MDVLRPQHRRSKSSTSVLKSIVSPKSLSKSSKEKENTTPPSSSSSHAGPVCTPIWAEFATTKTEHVNSAHSHTAAKMALNDRSVEQETNFYTPRDYSPSKQRNFHDVQQPVLAKKGRPKSEFLSKSKSSMTIFESAARSSTDQPTMPTRRSVETTPSSFFKPSKTTKVPLKSEKPVDKMAKATKSASKELLTMARKGTKVMGLVAAFNSRSDPATAVEPELDPKEIDAAFEAVLVRTRLSLLPSVKCANKTQLGVAKHSREYASEFTVSQDECESQFDQVQ
jgi:hypothetical protein